MFNEEEVFSGNIKALKRTAYTLTLITYNNYSR